MTTTTEDEEKSNTIKAVFWVVVVFGFVVIFTLLTSSPGGEKPAEDKPKEIVYNLSWDGSVLQVESWLKQNLKDPGSFEAIEWGKVVKNANGYFVRCKYRAKNSFGGYAVENKLFMLNSGGEVVTVTDFE